MIESFSQIASAHAAIWPVQGAGTLSRLLVLEAARRTSAVTTSAQAAHGGRIRAEIRSAHPGGNWNLLRRDGGGDEGPLQPHLLSRIRPSARPARYKEIFALFTHSNSGG